MRFASNYKLLKDIKLHLRYVTVTNILKRFGDGCSNTPYHHFQNKNFMKMKKIDLLLVVYVSYSHAQYEVCLGQKKYHDQSSW